MSKFITSSRIFEEVRKAGLLDDDPNNIRRVVIDLEAGAAAKIYVERFADDEKLAVAFAEIAPIIRQGD